MGFDKLLANLSGKPVLQHSIEAFLFCHQVEQVILACPEERYQALDLSQATKPIQRIDGGKDRHDSVAASLAAIPDGTNYIAVHDGARPLISGKQIETVFQTAIKHGAAASARPVTETIKRASPTGVVSEALNREHLWLMETPQLFRADLLLKAYEQVAKSGARVTDEVSAMELIGQPVHLTTNDSLNPKITYPADIEQAQKFLT